MKTANPALIQLIRRLSDREYKQILQHLRGRRRKDSLFVQLLEHLRCENKLPAWSLFGSDEVRARARYKVYKKLLFDKVVEAMAVLFPPCNPSMQARQWLQQVEMLYERGWTQQAWVRLQQVLRYAQVQKLPWIALEGQHWLDKLLFQRASPPYTLAAIDSQYQQLRLSLQAIDYYLCYQRVYLRLITVAHRLGYPNTLEEQQVFRDCYDPVLFASDLPVCVVDTAAELLYYKCQSIYHYYIGQFEQADEWASRQIAAAERQPEFLRQQMGNLLQIYIQRWLYQLGAYMIGAVSGAQLQDLLEDFKAFEQRTKTLFNLEYQQRIQNLRGDMEANICLLCGDFERGIAVLLPRAPVVLAQEQGQMLQQVNLFLLYFAQGDYIQALRYGHLVWEQRYRRQAARRSDALRAVGCMLGLALYLEGADLVVLETHEQALRRYLRKLGGVWQYERHLLQLYKRLLDASRHPRHYRVALAHYCEQLRQIDSMQARLQFNYFPYIYWCESQLSGGDFRGLLRLQFFGLSEG